MDYLIYNLADAALAPLANEALLSAEELLAANKRGARYLLVRCLLRRELARRLNCSPQEVRLHYGPQGKPACEGLEFNLSHSGDYLALAFDARPIGVDIERIRPRARMNALAARIMNSGQLEAFCRRQCPAEDFYACWCTAEALVKQEGKSIWNAVHYPFTYDNGRIRLPEDSGKDVRLFCPAPGYMGALATHRPDEG